MKTKRLLALFLSIVLCLCLVACKQNKSNENVESTYTSETVTNIESETNNNEQINTPLLYKVSDEVGNIVWLFGSIHIGRKDYYPLPDYVLNAFDSSQTLAVEADIVAFEKDISAQTKAIKYLLYSDGTTIKDHIPQELYNDAVNILNELGSYMSAFDYYKPMLWVSMIESLQYEKLGAKSDLGIDRHLIKRAKRNDKEIFEIESEEFQYNIMTNFSDELQILLLEETVKSNQNINELKTELQHMMDLWASGDKEGFVEYLAADTTELTDEELVLFNEYNDALITQRNISMTNYAENALKSGKETFICVGAAHIVGDGAIADLMQQRGYAVEVINN